jgi:hypothetical protein
LLQRHRYHILTLLLVAASLLVTLVPARAFASDDGTRTSEYATWDDLSGKKLGMVTGASFESKLREKCPGVGDVSY